ncbi:uncharacterized protein CCR75_005088 [Bremia lactucae]|uniref:Uncharacterized protein n=1 Tax=Bremia lactucae TaxID=4779 RepID=A0A976IM99_BRELC|nr:hypothetical protein CCR75_005088 [Bremia lactucae]
MKIFATFFAVLAATSTSTFEAVHVKVSSTENSRNSGALKEKAHEKALAKKQNMFYRMATMKSTPWDSEPKEREAKCEDLCMLNSFWEFQQGRNCYNNPSELCPVYKAGLASMDVVLTVTECTCNDSPNTSSTNSDD